MKNKLLAGGIFLAVIFISLTVLVQMGLLKGIDEATTREIQKIIPQTFDLPLSLFSLLGTAELASLILLIPLIFLKGLSKLLVLSSYILTGVFELIGKSLIAQNAPPFSLLRTYQFFKVPSGEISGHFFSYPSGHSARTAFVSAVLLFILWTNPQMKTQTKEKAIAIIIFFDFLMFGSRIYLGEHWLTDVVGGAILGFVLFIVCVLFSRRVSHLRL